MTRTAAVLASSGVSESWPSWAFWSLSSVSLSFVVAMMNYKAGDSFHAFIATNMSMMTTAQSAIAADLDAFAEATWFTSAYMV